MNVLRGNSFKIKVEMARGGRTGLWNQHVANLHNRLQGADQQGQDTKGPDLQAGANDGSRSSLSSSRMPPSMGSTALQLAFLLSHVIQP